MNPELEKQLVILLSKAMEGAEKTGQFVIDQAPDLLKEFYMWHLSINIFTIFTCLVLIFIYYMFGKGISQKEEDVYYDVNVFGRWFDADRGETVTMFIIGMLGLIIILPLILSSILNIIQIIVTPKLFLIEYILSLT